MSRDSWRVRGVAAGLLICSVVAPCPGARAEPTEVTKDELQAIESEFRALTLELRPLQSVSRVGYLVTEQGTASFEILPAKLGPTSQALPVRVTRVRRVSGHVEVRIENDKLGRADVQLWQPFGEVLTAPMVRDLMLQFLRRTDDRFLASMVIGNRKSHVFHSRAANHLPRPEDRDTLLTREIAISRGYRECPICFWREPPLPDYPVEKRLGAEAAAQFLVYHPVVVSESLATRVERAGRRTLQEWPLALRGYDYRFQVVEGEEPNALALPAGRVFVTRALMNAVESDDELEMVLAHEIAHVERRHGYIQYRRAQAAQAATGVLGALAGVFIMSRGGSPGDASIAMDAATMIGAVASSIVLAGYSRDLEEEADSYALFFARDDNEKVEAFESCLAKLEAFEERGGLFTGGVSFWDSHPELRTRIARAKSTQIESLTGTPRFVGLDAEGQELVSISFEAQSQAVFDVSEIQVVPKRHSISSFRGGTAQATGRIRHETEPASLFATITTSASFAGSFSIGTLSIQDETGERTFVNENSASIGTCDQLSVRFEGSSRTGLLQLPIKAARLPLFPGVESWVMGWD